MQKCTSGTSVMLPSGFPFVDSCQFHIRNGILLLIFLAKQVEKKKKKKLGTQNNFCVQKNKHVNKQSR